MHFHSEEELDIWYAEEKQKLDDAFTKQMDSDHEKMNFFKEKYDVALKKLIAKYQAEGERMVLLANKNAKK